MSTQTKQKVSRGKGISGKPPTLATEVDLKCRGIPVGVSHRFRLPLISLFIAGRPAVRPRECRSVSSCGFGTDLRAHVPPRWFALGLRPGTPMRDEGPLPS